MTYRFATLADADACNRFHNEYYGHDRKLDEWKWEFADNRGGNPIYVVIEHEGQMIGQQGAMPIRLIDQHGVFMSVKPEDTLVHLDALKLNKNAFAELYKMLEEPMSELSVRATWGFTPRSVAFKRIGYEVALTTSQLVYCASPQFLGIISTKIDLPKGAKGIAYSLGARAAAALASMRTSIAIMNRGPRNVQVRRLLTPPINLERVSESFVKTWGGVTIYRDASYIQWRHFDNPFMRVVMLGAFLRGEIVGWVSFSVDGKSIGYVVDLIVGAEGLARSTAEAMTGLLLREAVRHMRGMGVYGIRAWTINDHPYDLCVQRQAKKLGFFHVSKGESMMFRRESTRPEGDFPPPSEWYVNRLFMDGTSG